MSWSKHGIALSVYPNARGFAYVAFEGALSPVDWNVSDVRGKEKNRECLSRIAKLFGKYDPYAVVLPDVSQPEANRADRIRRLNEAIVALADTQSIPVFPYAAASVRACFRYANIRNKY